MSFTELDQYVRQLTDKKIIPAASLAVAAGGEMLCSRSYGSVYESGRMVHVSTRFDIASMTKILSGLTFMRFVEEGVIGLEEPICEIFPRMGGLRPIEKDGEIIGQCDASQVTWKHVLTHTSGMGWTRKKTRPSLPHLDQGLEDIYELPFAAPIGERVIYSDIFFILMGRALEIRSGMKLDELTRMYVTDPLGLKNTGFLRISKGEANRTDIAPTEYDELFRGKRIWAQVHDENAYLLDGVAAHAGIFSTAEDMCRIAMECGRCLKEDGMLRKETMERMIRCAAMDDGERRGLMWQLSGRGEKAYTRILSPAAYGHAGFTGCFFWNDPEMDLSVVFLSNDIYNGREHRRLFEFRTQIMRLAAEAAMNEICKQRRRS